MTRSVKAAERALFVAPIRLAGPLGFEQHEAFDLVAPFVGHLHPQQHRAVEQDVVEVADPVARANVLQDRCRDGQQGVAVMLAQGLFEALIAKDQLHDRAHHLNAFGQLCSQQIVDRLGGTCHVFGAAMLRLANRHEDEGAEQKRNRQCERHQHPQADATRGRPRLDGWGQPTRRLDKAAIRVPTHDCCGGGVAWLRRQPNSARSIADAVRSHKQGERGELPARARRRGRQARCAQTRINRHTARASIARPSPTGPIFSAVFALTLT